MKYDISRELYPYEKVLDIEPKPGLYAWYLRIRIGRGNIETYQNFSKALKRVTEQIRHPTLTMQLKGHLNLNMKGDLKHIWYGHHEQQFTKKFEEMLNSPEERELIREILDLAAPLLTAPLYIGVSKNLQQRLQTHMRLIEKNIKRHQEDTTLDNHVDSTDSLQNDKDFAERIVERNIDPNHLIVGVTYVSHPNLLVEKIRKSVETTETLLNRMFYPILGRK